MTQILPFSPPITCTKLLVLYFKYAFFCSLQPSSTLCPGINIQTSFEVSLLVTSHPIAEPADVELHYLPQMLEIHVQELQKK